MLLTTLDLIAPPCWWTSDWLTQCRLKSTDSWMGVHVCTFPEWNPRHESHVSIYSSKCWRVRQVCLTSGHHLFFDHKDSKNRGSLIISTYIIFPFQFIFLFFQFFMFICLSTEMRLHPSYVYSPAPRRKQMWAIISCSASKMSHTCTQYSNWVPQGQSKEHDEVDWGSFGENLEEHRSECPYWSSP